MRRAVLLAAILAVSGLTASASVSARSAVTDPCRKPGEVAVSLETSDGAKVYGVAVGKGSTGVVLAHQAFSDHCEWMDFARELARRGMRALAIDLRDNGVSRGGAPGRYDRDVAAAAAWLRANGTTHVQLVGASMGATSVLVAAASIRPAVDGVVSLSAPARYYELNALPAVKRSRVPVRFVAGTQDTPFALDARKLMRAAVAKDKRSLLLPTSLHGSSLLQLQRAKAFVMSFLTR